MDFKCSFCKKEMQNANKYRIESDQYDYDDSGNLTGEFSFDEICETCHDNAIDAINNLIK